MKLRCERMFLKRRNPLLKSSKNGINESLGQPVNITMPTKTSTTILRIKDFQFLISKRFTNQRGIGLKEII